MTKAARSEFDVHLRQVLRKDPLLAEEYARQFAEVPLPTQLAIMRRRATLTQKALAKAMRVKQPHVARLERSTHDPQLSSVLNQARALHCHLMVVPDELLARVARMVAEGQSGPH